MPRNRMERVWFFSPAIATAIFFSAQLLLSFTSQPQDARLAGARVEAPKSTNVKVRVVEQIRAADASPQAASQVPTTEAQLMELFDRDGAVIFFSDEVEVVETPAQRFDTDEVGVITLRRAKLVR